MSHCYVIAEAGSNHNGDIDLAFRLIDVAAEAKADAIKFQLFRADHLYTKSAGQSHYLRDARSIVDILRTLELPAEWIPLLAKRANDAGLDFLSTAFHEDAVDIVDPYVPKHKCASYELTHHPLLHKLAQTGKPLILSTGTCSLAEVAEAVAAIEPWISQLTLLQCTAKYPTPLNQVHLRAMQTMSQAFGVPVGLSDHSRHPTCAPAAAVALGASVVEKHFTLSNNLPGPDHGFALEPHELCAMVQAIRDTEAALGDARKEPLEIEAELRQFARRSIFAIRPIQAGETFSTDNARILRCGQARPGLPPRRYPEILGKASVRDLASDDAIREEDVHG